MARNTAQRLVDIREAATDLRDFVEDLQGDTFHALPHADRMGYRAIKNALTELGEAIKALPPEICERHKEVDWQGFCGLRDMVAHQYFGIDTHRLLPIIKGEIPRLLAAIDIECQLDELDGPGGL
jgi:uncharacterized protein with HEPN domain